MNQLLLQRVATVLTSFLLLPASLLSQSSRNSSQVDSVTAHYWADYLLMNPMSATSLGNYNYNDQLENTISTTYVAEAINMANRYLDSISGIRPEEIDEKKRLVLDIFRFTLQRDLDGFKMGVSDGTIIERPVNQFVFSRLTTFASAGSGSGAIPFKTVKQYDDWISRLKAFPAWIDTAIVKMNMGIRNGNTNPQAPMLNVSAQLQPLYLLPADSSIFYKPILNLPASFTGAEKELLATAFRTVIDESIRPAYRKMDAYLSQTYIPAARKSSGLLHNARGKDEYRYWIRFWTTSDMDPEKIFEYGLSEVARIRREMDSIRLATGFKGDLKSFFEYVKTDAKFFPFKTQEEVLERFRSFKTKMQHAIPGMFHLVPAADFEIRATEKFREKGANAQYKRGSLDGTRPGIFYEVIPNAPEYNYSDMETLFLHEAIPGHHFQVALQQQMDAPAFMKNSFYGAFSEGWGLYAETLGKDMGFYTDPYQYLGRLNADMERSVRLVVDVGLHYKGWSREKAIDYIIDNQPLTREVAEQRIERYMVLPAQALSYKVGEQKILELRTLAQQKLGNKFSLPAFHDQILKDGAMPLSILDAKIRRWIDSVNKQ